MLRAEFVMTILSDEEDFISLVDLRYVICFWSPHGRVLLEERNIAQLVKNSPACIGPDAFYHVRNIPQLGCTWTK
jgi:hypothetical protein